MTAIGGTAIIITRASQRTGPIGLLRNDRAEFVTGMLSKMCDRVIRLYDSMIVASA